MHKLFVGKTCVPTESLQYIIHSSKGKEEFEKMAVLDRLLCRKLGMENEISPFEIRMAEAGIISRLEKTKKEKLWYRWRWVFIAASTFVTILCLAVLLPLFQITQNSVTDRRDKPDTTSLFIPRGKNKYKRSSVYVYCLREKQGEVDFRPASRKWGCSLSESIKFGYVNPNSDLSYLSIFGIDSNSDIMWYFPNPIDQKSLKIKKTLNIVPIGKPIKLRVNHKAGILKIFAIFSKEPIIYKQLQKRIQDALLSQKAMPSKEWFPLEKEEYSVAEIIKIEEE
jgi:hypothetical protein